jgi:hypothetical protein
MVIAEWGACILPMGGIAGCVGIGIAIVRDCLCAGDERIGMFICIAAAGVAASAFSCPARPLCAMCWRRCVTGFVVGAFFLFFFAADFDLAGIGMCMPGIFIACACACPGAATSAAASALARNNDVGGTG